MKKIVQILFASVLAVVLFTPSVQAIYTGEEQDEPKEGEVQILKMVEQPEVEEVNAEVTTTNETTVLEEEVLSDNEKIPPLFIVGGLLVIGVMSVFILKRKK